jgi:hypothetical protein
MTAPLIGVAKFTRDLLGVDEQLIRPGRHNFTQDEMTRQYIVIDVLSLVRVSESESFDGDSEEVSYGDIWRGTFTLDFYGTDAYNRAKDFGRLARSQTAAELKRALGLTIYRASRAQNVAQLTGQQYGERWQVEIVVDVSEATMASTLRIDEAQLQIRSERGIEYDG